MSITNEFNYYVNPANKIKKYPEAICNTVNKIICDSQNPNNCFIDNSYLNEITINIFTSLPRVINAAESYPCIADNDIVERNDKISIILKRISSDIIEEFEDRNYQVKVFEGIRLEDGGLNFKKKR